MRRKQVDPIGCIDPHGVWPFPASRENCPKCQAIRAQRKPSLRRGLPFRWWKSVDLWSLILVASGLAFLAVALFGAWFTS